MPSRLNVLLSKAAVTLRRNRINFWDDNDFVIRKSTFQGRKEAGLWFKTKGCSLDRMGCCAMCNYSAGPETSAEQMISYVEQGLREIPENLWGLLISPSGSFMDDLEVPEKARSTILRLILNKGCTSYSFETRPETVTEAKADAIRKALGDRQVFVYMGLETASSWVSLYSLNKALDLNEFPRSATILFKHGIQTIANVLLGAPFLSSHQAIEDTLATIDWALSCNGVQRCCIFPVNIKKNTVVNWLFEHGHYTQPSLWSLVEVLSRLGPKVASNRIELAWYMSYGSGYVIHPPDSCPNCRAEVSRLLNSFAETSRYAIVERLARMDCACREKWKEDQKKSDEQSPYQKAKEAYDGLGMEFGGEWWTKSRGQVLETMRTAAEKAFGKGTLQSRE